MTKHLTNKVLQLSQTIKTVSLQDVVEVWPEISHFEFNPRNHPLVLAAGSGRAELVEFLLPFAQDYFTHKAFEVSAQREHLHVLKLFIGCVDPNGNKGQALQWAMYNKDYPMIDFLLDLVNPKDALDMMKPAWGVRSRQDINADTFALDDAIGAGNLQLEFFMYHLAFYPSKCSEVNRNNQHRG